MKRLKILIPFLIIMLLLTGCQSSANTAPTNTTAVAVAAAGLTAVVPSTSTIAVDPEFSDRDLKTTYDDSTAVHVTMAGTTIQVSGDGATASGGVLTISKEGVYVVTGSLSDGQIMVAAADTDKVQIVLNGVTINCADNAPIYIKSANKVFITLGKDTVNTLTDGSAYVQTDENTVDSVIFSKADLTINGEGTLNITANYKHAIVSKDDLVITGGTYNITSVKDALSSKNCIKIKDGVINITSATGKGITSKNDEDNTKGYVYICGGTIKIANSVEGIEGTAIIVEGGTIDITSQDDGFNAADGITTTTNSNGPGGGAMEADANCYLTISGGTININATGDGIDSNGNLYISGGTIYVSGPTANDNGALDYNGTAEITGGTTVAAGSSGMAQGFSDTSTQYSLLNNFTTACAAGTEITLTDASGNTIVSYTPVKSYQSVVISSPALQNGATYTLTSGSQTAAIALTSVVTSNGQATGMGGGKGGGQGGGMKPQ
ncbi:carbohydrate-binding domain-containing protein [Acetobacterium paludosum]|nr:carbohydrate-binding domain-containing protein [Acetobacterium paludosum]